MKYATAPELAASMKAAVASAGGAVYAREFGLWMVAFYTQNGVGRLSLRLTYPGLGSKDSDWEMLGAVVAAFGADLERDAKTPLDSPNPDFTFRWDFPLGQEAND